MSIGPPRRIGSLALLDTSTHDRAGSPPSPPEVAATRADVDAVAVLLGRPPQGDFTVVVRHDDGSPLVIRNAALLDDGTPMPTRYWLVGEPERTWVGRLESEGAIDEVESIIGLDTIAEAHERYAAEREAALPSGHAGPRPSGGVGGTRVGVKCLHAHLAWHLAGGDDPVGRWVAHQIEARPELRAPRTDRGDGQDAL